MRAFWVTFYSYKGGVGRTLALANLAALLVKRGRRIVLIDFDLEAPGLDSFQEFGAVVGQPGVVEYAVEFIQTRRAPNIADFVHPCALLSPGAGKLWIMPAGRKDDAYGRGRAAIDWARLYDDGDGEPFIDNWKAAIHNAFQPDFVFVDSRTGLTEVGGVCTLHLPDLVVMLFGLNEQNVKGIAAVAKAIRASGSPHPPLLHFVASPVPNLPSGKGAPLAGRMEAARKALGGRVESEVRYCASAALRESLVSLSSAEQDSPLARDYEALLGRLVAYHRNGIDFLSRQADEAIAAADPNRMEQVMAALKEDFLERADGLWLMSRLASALGRRDEAIALAKRSMALEPVYVPPAEWLLAHYQSTCQWCEALEVCDSLLADPSRLPTEELSRLWFKRGCVAMAAGDYRSATDSFRSHIDVKTDDFDAVPLELLFFSFRESIRRSTGRAPQDKWKDVLLTLAICRRGSDWPLPVQAHRWQASYIAYALLGKTARAREALIKAGHAAALAGKAEGVLNVKTFTEVPVAEFQRINAEMLAALDRGQLWDGMPLPSSPSEDEVTENPRRGP